MSFLQGKRALIVGVASDRSIAAGIARAMHAQGAELAFTYQTEKLKSRAEKVATETGSEILIEMDVASDAQINAAFSALKNHWDQFDIIVHSVGFAPREELSGRFVDSVTREGFGIAHDISAYSFAALAKAGLPMLREGGSLLTLSYLGAVRSVPNYNVMGPAKASLEATTRFLAQDLGPEGIRVNCISAGPIKTLAAAGVAGFRSMLSKCAEVSPLRKNVTAEDVGNTAAFLCSDLAGGITGEVVYVDAGYRNTAMSGLGE